MGAAVAADRRTSGAMLEDERIEIKADIELHKLGDQAHIDVICYNRNVLLVGQALSEDIRTQAENIVKKVENVRSITNEVAVSSLSSLVARSNDVYLTSKVKARMLDAQKFQVNYVKVVTENGVVYLLGLVTHKEAEQATEIARTTAGVQRVVKVFEYID
jgi:osmotically-inducible protein OsmY